MIKSGGVVEFWERDSACEEVEGVQVTVEGVQVTVERVQVVVKEVQVTVERAFSHIQFAL